MSINSNHHTATQSFSSRSHSNMSGAVVPSPSRNSVAMDPIDDPTKSTAQVLHEAAEETAQFDGVPDADGVQQQGGLAKVLTVWDVIAYGIGSTLGAGIFAITASGTEAAGPAIVLSFMVAAIACLFSAFSYMEFAARVPIAGSAYTFTYVCLGELAAWFVGWNLTLEYAISAAVVARTWSQNLELFINNVGGNYPAWLSSYSVSAGVISDLSIMSAVICLLCMGILLVGVKESSNFNIFITTLNICVILFVIIAGSFHVKTENWTAPATPGGEHTYFPKGVNGIITGAAVVFFSYIGFDSVTTLAEEVKNPKRDLPIGIIATLIISTMLYVATTIVVTGMQPWYIIQNYDAPLANAFDAVGMKWASTLISGATVTALTGNTLTSLFGQPRIFYRMAKDGLLFSPFAKLHPTTKAPFWGTIWSGVAAALIAFLIPLDSLADMISIGTLLAFSTVCAGVVILRYEEIIEEVPAAGEQQGLMNPAAGDDADAGAPLNPGQNASYGSDGVAGRGGASQLAFKESVQIFFVTLPSRTVALYHVLKSSSVFWLGIFMIPCVCFCASLRHTDTCPIYIIVFLGILTVLPVYMIYRLPVNMKNWPKEGNFVCPLVPWLPCLGIFTNCYLIASLGIFSYVRIVVWTAIGFLIYFLYGIFHSTILEKLEKYNDMLALQKEDPRDAGYHGDDAAMSGNGTNGHSNGNGHASSSTSEFGELNGSTQYASANERLI